MFALLCSCLNICCASAPLAQARAPVAVGGQLGRTSVTHAFDSDGWIYYCLGYRVGAGLSTAAHEQISSAIWGIWEPTARRKRGVPRPTRSSYA